MRRSFPSHDHYNVADAQISEVLIASAVMAEGVDLHRYCRYVDVAVGVQVRSHTPPGVANL